MSSSTLDDLVAPASLPLQAGEYWVRQGTGYYMTGDNSVGTGSVGLAAQEVEHGSQRQRWYFTPVGAVCTVRQRSSNRFLDAFEGGSFSAVTRGGQGDDTQRWVALPSYGSFSTYTLYQLSSTRRLDAHEGQTFSVVTREAQNNNSQQWKLSSTGEGISLQQVSTGRFLDAYESGGFDVVTRPPQHNETQRWLLDVVGGVYTIQQADSGKLLDAHESGDFAVVTRPPQHNDTQRWVVRRLGGFTHSIQQLSSARFLDGHHHQPPSRPMVTRPRQQNASQRWDIAEQL